MHADGDWQIVEGVLKKDVATVGGYLQTWKINFSTTQTASAVFHRKNKAAKLKLKVKYNKEILPVSSELKFFGVTLDRSLTQRRHLESLHKKLASCDALFRRFAGSVWSAGATTLQIATLALVHSTAEYWLLSGVAPDNLTPADNLPS